MKAIVLLIFFTFTLHNCKEGKEIQKEHSSEYPNSEITLPLIFTPVKEIRKDFILNGKNYSYEYNIDGKIIRISSSNTNNGFYNEIVFNDKIIGKSQNNSLTSVPYYYKNKNLGLLFIEEGDENGIWGYNIFLVKEKISEIGFLDISSTKNSHLNKFLSLSQDNNLIIFNFLETKIFSQDQIINKSDETVKIDIKTLKIVKEFANKQSSNIDFSFDQKDFNINFKEQKITPKSEYIYFENNLLVVKKTFEDNNPHNIINYKFYFDFYNQIKIDKIEFSKNTYVEQNNICKIYYTYLPKNGINVSINSLNSFTENNLSNFIRKLTLKQALEIVSTNNKNYQCTSLLNTEEIIELLEKFPISISTINNYNNIAYYLQESHINHEAILILNNILKKFPDRVVAYLNLADAYWEEGKKEKAVANYRQYVSLMKSQGKDLNKIPERVYTRGE
ncbi:tetratricopeptide repeat protein [Chryseobacterium sp. C39-AII1]|uniref:tetratricopeptide repeat protein n=1 Tax=Chryseobacterium sp. C39-AII1 TaxID=3080332 RepID=UPI00320902F2